LKEVRNIPYDLATHSQSNTMQSESLLIFVDRFDFINFGFKFEYINEIKCVAPIFKLMYLFTKGVQF